jgi:hypothetical protein
MGKNRSYAAGWNACYWGRHFDEYAHPAWVAGWEECDEALAHDDCPGPLDEGTGDRVDFGRPRKKPTTVKQGAEHMETKFKYVDGQDVTYGALPVGVLFEYQGVIYIRSPGTLAVRCAVDLDNFLYTDPYSGRDNRTDDPAELEYTVPDMLREFGYNTPVNRVTRAKFRVVGDTSASLSCY